MKWGEPVAMGDPEAWRQWLEDNHASAGEIFLLLVKDRSQKHGLRYEEAVQEALCFGWIDGIARRHDDDFSLNRFTPRRPNANWSASNRRRIQDLAASGRLKEPGLAVLPGDLRSELGL